jgi:hypothetical protein
MVIFLWKLQFIALKSSETISHASVEVTLNMSETSYVSTIKVDVGMTINQ